MAKHSTSEKKFLRSIIFMSCVGCLN